MYANVHVLQTMPFSNLNRDDDGAPKTMFYGGVPRWRLSSQSQKRPVRLAIEKQLDEPAKRTARIAALVATHLREKHEWDEDTARKAVRAIFGGESLTMVSDCTNTLRFVPKSVVNDFADICLQHREEIAAASLPEPGKSRDKNRKEKAEKAPVIFNSHTTKAIDSILKRRSETINLFGRMHATDASHNIDGTVSVSHAFTTHAATHEIDYFTAVDDANTDKETGAGYVDAAMFGGGTFYRYAAVNLSDLADTNKLGDWSTVAELAALFGGAFTRIAVREATS